MIDAAPDYAKEGRVRAPLVERKYLTAFVLVATLFFSWALAASLNDVLVRQFQKALDLTRTGSSLIQLAFYIGYFCAALPAGYVIRKVGYKSTILAGLSLYALGAFLFYPAAEVEQFGFFLVALYIIAFGLAFLETAANPYVSILGSPETASARLNLAQSFYGVGAVLGPIIGGAFIFSGIEHSHADIGAMSTAQLAAYRTAEAHTVQGPYLMVALAVCVLALLVARTKFPQLPLEAQVSTVPKGSLVGVLRRKHLLWAVVAQFFYVGAQVTIWSFFIDFSKGAMPGLAEKTTAYLLSGSLGALFVGRFSGAFIQRYVPAPVLLLAYALANIVLCLLAVFGDGAFAVGSLWLTSFFMSIMFPTIFALGITNLGRDTNIGSSFLIMSIIGGAIIPPVVGLISESIGIHHAMVVPAICFAICAAFAATVPKLIKEDQRRRTGGRVD